MRHQPQQHQQNANQPPLRQRVEGLAAFIALCALVNRKNVGYYVLDPFRLFALAACMMFGAQLFPHAARPQDLCVYAVLMFLNGCRQRLQRWGEMLKGEFKHHGWYIGDSNLESLPLPKFMRVQRRLPHVFEPPLYGLVGLIILPYSPLLGLFLLLAGSALNVTEDAARRRQILEILDLHNGLFKADFHTREIERLSESRGQDADVRKPPTAVATGPGDDVQEQIARRKAKRIPPKI